MFENPTPWIGVSATFRELDEEVREVARANTRTLLTGEGGVGKELVARLIHTHSRRARNPFVAVTCTGITDSRLRFVLERAHGGTLFLEQVDAISPAIQAVLVQFLDDGKVSAVGSDDCATVDVRIISATTQPLFDHVVAGRFREDLYYRLNVVHLVVPPLRERHEDILPLLDHYLVSVATEYGTNIPTLTAEAMAWLRQYPWPGNIREVTSVAERLVAACGNGTIGLDELQSVGIPATNAVAAAQVVTRSSPGAATNARFD